MLLPVLILLVNYITANAQGVNSFIKCDPFSGSDTASATRNYQLCQIDNVCPGVKLIIGDCSSSCSGDQFIRLFDADNTNQLAGNDDGACESPLNLCSRMEYSYQGAACTSMVLRQGCFEGETCSGRIKVTYIYTSAPTYAPSALPTATPSFRPTAAPTFTPTVAVMLGANDVSCAPYTASSTDNARSRYAVCNFQVCPGTVLTVGNCGDSCSGDQFIRLFDGSNNLVMYDDDGCDADPYSLCSQLTYVYRTGVCQTFSLHQGCYEGDSCGGTMSIVKATTPAPTSLPTAFPTAKPSSEPTSVPTAVPSSIPTTKPSAEPTVTPTAKPSSTPTAAPTLQPLTGFATANINDLTSVIQSVWYRTKYVGVVMSINDCTYNLADDTACQAAYPNAQIVTIMVNGLPVKLAMSGERRAPTALPTAVPTIVPTTSPSSTPTVIQYRLSGSTTYTRNYEYFSVNGVTYWESFTCRQACSYEFYRSTAYASQFHCSTSASSVSFTGWAQGNGQLGCSIQNENVGGGSYSVTSNINTMYTFFAYDDYSQAVYGVTSCGTLAKTNYCWVLA